MSSVITKPNKESYGDSTIELVEMPMTEDSLSELQVDGKKILLPVLNVKKHDPNCRCYALIERMKQRHVTFVDLIYSYQPIELDALDAAQKEKFFKGIARCNINAATRTFPGMLWIPRNQAQMQSLATAIKDTLAEEINTKVLIVNRSETQSVTVKKAPAPEEVVDDGLILELIKSFYESITLSKVRRPRDPITKQVDSFIQQRAIFIKSGSMIVNGAETSKYLTRFQMDSQASEEIDQYRNHESKGMYSVYIAGMDDKELFQNQDYLDKFGDVILQSQVLEALAIVDDAANPRLLYAGEYNPSTERMELGESVGQYVKQINNLMFPKNRTRSQGGSGR